MHTNLYQPKRTDTWQLATAGKCFSYLTVNSPKVNNLKDTQKQELRDDAYHLNIFLS